MATNLTCTNSDNRFILEFIGCDLVVVQNSETVFKAKGLSLCPWFDEVCDYCYCKHTIAKNGTISVAGPLNANFIYMQIEWPSHLAESKRRAAIQLPKFNIINGVFTDQGLGKYDDHTYPLQDLFMINSVDQYEEYKLHNYSDETIVVHVITATHCDSTAGIGTSGATGNYPTGGTSVPDYIG